MVPSHAKWHENDPKMVAQGCPLRALWVSEGCSLNFLSHLGDGLGVTLGSPGSQNLDISKTNKEMCDFRLFFWGPGRTTHFVRKIIKNGVTLDPSWNVKSCKNAVLLFKIKVSRKFISCTFMCVNAGLGLDFGRVLGYFLITLVIEGRSRRPACSYWSSKVTPDRSRGVSKGQCREARTVKLDRSVRSWYRIP